MPPLAAPTPSPVPYPPRTDAERAALLKFIRETPIAFGTWRGLKALYKAIEADPNAEPELLGEIIGRLDAAPLSLPKGQDVSVELGDIRQVQQMIVRDGRLFVQGGRNTGNVLGIFDLTSPDVMKPRQLAQFNVTNAGWFTVCGSTMAVCSAPGGRRGGTLHVYDISDPTKPAKRTELPINAAGPIASSYPYVFVPCESPNSGGDGFNGLRIVSVANPDAPEVVAQLAIENASQVVLTEDGGLAAVVVGATGFSWNRLPKAGGVRFVDLTIPTRPKLLGSLDLSGIQCAAFHGETLLLGIGQNSGRGRSAGIVLYETTNPTKPQPLGTYKTQYNAGIAKLAVFGNSVIALTDYNAPVILDISNLSAPKRVAELPGLWYSQSVALNGTTAYVGGSYDTTAWNLSTPEKPVRAGTPPSADTMGYIKRRARRQLWELAKQDPARYVEVATYALIGSGRVSSVLDPKSAWVTMDILTGGGARYNQTRHGRGGYRLKKGVTEQIRRLHRREERLPAAWDRRPDLAAQLLTSPSLLPVQTYEMAARVLRATRSPIPTVGYAGTLEQWLKSDSTLLSILATRMVAERMETGQKDGAELAARAYFRAGGVVRQRIMAALPKVGKRDFETSFARSLGEIIAADGIENGTFFRSSRKALEMLITRYPDAMIPESRLQLAGPLLRAQNPAFTGLLTTALRKTENKNLGSTVAYLSNVEAAYLEPALQALEESVRGKTIPHHIVTTLTMHGSNEVGFAIGWRIVAASNVAKDTIHVIWTELLNLRYETEAVRAAMRSPHAIALLPMAGITADEISSKLRSRPHLAALLSPETFGRIAQSAPPSVLLRLTATIEDTHWNALREAWLRNLREGVGLLELWKEIPAALDEDNDDRILNRVVRDPDFADTFRGIDEEHAAELIELRAPALDTLLSEWAARHPDAFPRDSATLTEAAIHILPGVRAWGLARLQSVGFGLPVALRLMECEVPQSVAVGKAFFEAIPAGGDREFDYALALCDSPIRAVRRYGREYVRGRWDTLPRTDLYRALFENLDTETQTFVATLLNDEPARPVETPQFDRDVLRARNKSRAAKEAVKARQETEGTVDVETLLSMARGSGTPRDAEWALSQLARRALAGEQIPGFSIEGVAG
jgi:hypothetical protein